MTDCITCGAALKPQTKFCTACGAAVPPAKPICPSCSLELRAGARFCTACGATAAAAPAAAPAEVPSTAPAGQPATGAAPEPQTLAIRIFAGLGVGGALMLAAGILMIVSVTKPWFTVEGLGTLAWNEGYVWTRGYEGFKPSSPISADIGYFAVILGAAGVILGLLNVSDAAPDWEGKLDQAWLRVIGRFFADRGICLLVLAAIIARFVTRQDETQYAIGIYLFLVAAVALTVGSIMSGAEMAAGARAALAEHDES